MAFHDVRFPTRISFGSSGGPERRTEIVELANGFEERNTPWAHARRRYDAGYGLTGRDDLHEVIAFFEARRGRLHGFRYKDHTDFKSCPPVTDVTPADQPIGTGDGATQAFQLTKTYASGDDSYTRPIAKPVAGTVRIAVDGAEQTDGTDVTVDHTNGLVTFAFLAIPGPGASITAGYEFDVPVRFDTDHLDIRLSDILAGDIPSIPLVEVRV